MKPTSTIDIVLAVIQLIKFTIDLINKKEKKDEQTKKIISSNNAYHSDHVNVLDDYLGRSKK